MTELRQAIVALGSNLGNRRENLARALELLETSPGIDAIVPSPIYETEPVGLKDQRSFLNMVAGVETGLSPEALMALLLKIEEEMGRIRETRWGPRTIDLDLLFFEQEERQGPGLDLPHPRWAERAFVTVPLRDLLAHPAFDRPVWEPLRRRLSGLPPEDPGVRRMDPASFE